MNTELIATLVTELEGYVLNNQNVQLSGDMGTIELNELIKQLLLSENIDYNNEQFDFIIGNQLLRTTLQEHITQFELSTEKDLIINYIFAQQEPKLHNTQNTNDWIISIMDISNHILLGLSNGQIVVCNQDGKKIQTVNTQQQPNNAKYYAAQDNFILSTYWDGTLQLFQFINKSIQMVNSIKLTHFGESIAFNKKDSSRYCVGDDQGSLILFKTNTNNNDEMEEQYNFKIHMQMITVCNWIRESTIITGSMDHSIVLFSLKSNTILKQIFAKDSVITDLFHFNQQVISAHEDGYLKLWDTQSDNIAPARTYKSSLSTITSLSMNDHHQLIAGSFDGNVNLWDIRSQQPTFTLTGEGKILATKWINNKIVFGGSAKKLFVYIQK